MSEPVVHDKTIFLAADNIWSVRHKVSDVPVVPDSVKSQIRDEFNGIVWADLETTINDDGWIDIKLSKEHATLEEWQGRFSGRWDIYATSNGVTDRLVMGKITVSPNVTT